MSNPAPPPLPSLAQSLALIAAGLPQPAAGRGIRDRAMARLFLFLRTFLTRIAAQLEALAATLAAGPAPQTPATPLPPEPKAPTGQMQAPPNPGRLPRPRRPVPATAPDPAPRTRPRSPPPDQPPAHPWTRTSAKTPTPSARAPPG